MRTSTILAIFLAIGIILISALMFKYSDIVCLLGLSFILIPCITLIVFGSKILDDKESTVNTKLKAIKVTMVLEVHPNVTISIVSESIDEWADNNGFKLGVATFRQIKNE